MRPSTRDPNVLPDRVVPKALPDPPRQTKGPPLARRSHERLRAECLTGILDLKLTTESPLHVGSGAPALLPGAHGKGPEVVRSLLLVAGNRAEAVPVIPGASLKGVVRSLCEAIAGGCRLDAPCDPPCVICALFGHADKRGSFAGRIGFGDALPVDSEAALDHMGLSRLPQPHEPRRPDGRRLYGPAPRIDMPTQVPYEVVAEGVEFRFELQFVNVTLAELGLVMLALGGGGRFPLQVGGGKFAGLGLVRCAAVGLKLRTGFETPLPEHGDRAQAEEFVKKALAAYQPDERGQAILERIITVLRGGT